MPNLLNDGQTVAAITGAFLIGSKCFEVYTARWGTKTNADLTEKQQLWARITQVENKTVQVEQTAIELEKTLREALSDREHECVEWKRRAEKAESECKQLEWEMYIKKGVAIAVVDVRDNTSP